jgi:hypothetical protein
MVLSADYRLVTRCGIPLERGRRYAFPQRHFPHGDGKAAAPGNRDSSRGTLAKKARGWVGGQGDTRRTGILRVAKLALDQYRERGREPPVVRDLQRAVAEAERQPNVPFVVESVWSVLVTTPELKALLERECPECVPPLPFRGRAIVC